jgi:malate dehydrogenase (quinone)
LEFGTELVAAEDKSLVALLGASPGASTAALSPSACSKNVSRAISPAAGSQADHSTCGIDLAQDAAQRKTRADTGHLEGREYRSTRGPARPQVQ